LSPDVQTAFRHCLSFFRHARYSNCPFARRRSVTTVHSAMSHVTAGRDVRAHTPRLPRCAPPGTLQRVVDASPEGEVLVARPRESWSTAPAQREIGAHRTTHVAAPNVRRRCS